MALVVILLQSLLLDFLFSCDITSAGAGRLWEFVPSDTAKGEAKERNRRGQVIPTEE